MPLERNTAYMCMYVRVGLVFCGKHASALPWRVSFSRRREVGVYTFPCRRPMPNLSIRITICGLGICILLLKLVGLAPL